MRKDLISLKHFKGLFLVLNQSKTWIVVWFPNEATPTIKHLREFCDFWYHLNSKKNIYVTYHALWQQKWQNHCAALIEISLEYISKYPI